ncbi:MAG TPA: enoyl-CoA hydratase/isomerase family protein [Candidatus Binataceae bacterium]
MGYETLDLRHEGRVAWLTFNRPHSLNALNTVLVDEFRDFLTRLPADRNTRVVVLRGAGRAFCAGLDLKERNRADKPSGDGDSADPAEIGLRSQRKISEIALQMRRAPQPFIAAVHGAASGGGFAIALAADCRIAGESARFNAAFIRIGLSACDVGVSYFLPRLVGMSVASELLLTGRFINAQRALATGLVSELVPDEQLEEAARKLADDMIQTSPLGLRLTKECLMASVDAGNLEHAIFMEDRNQILCASSGNFAEGVRAFLEKRRPRYAD